MNYYYDLLLNFQEYYCMFYEWDKTDVLEYIKKVPIYHVNDKTYRDLLNKKIKVNKEFLNMIENKTKDKQNKKLKYISVFSDGKNSLALEFDSGGIVIYKSSLLLEDEINIHEFMFGVDIYPLKYEVISKDQIESDTRQNVKIKRLIKTELESIIRKKQYSKLKYIYLEWFDKLDDNYDMMYKKMIERLNSNLTNKEYEIYDLIRITYNV